MVAKEDACDEVLLPSSLGILGILPEHAQLFCEIIPGTVVMNKGDTSAFIHVEKGIAHVQDNKITVWVDQVKETL